MKTFPGKLLLFGEYTVLLGSKALAIPLPQFSGAWSFGEKSKATPLQEWLHYLRKLADAQELSAPFALQRFEHDLSQGLYFNSNIPVGYGLGSSGALCAAFYHRYCRSPILPENHAKQGLLRQQLAQLESHFHGNSSGADPLICYLQKAMLLGQGAAEQVSVPTVEETDIGFFLVDTQRSRQTAPLVQRFHRYYKENKVFRREVEQAWLPLAEQAIAQYRSGNRKALGKVITEISHVQYNLLEDWIPQGARPYWAEGLRQGSYSLKLCGAGGGGFLLGYGHLPENQLGPYPVTLLPKT